MQTIDIHSHFFPESWPDLAARFGSPDWPWMKPLDDGEAMIMLGDREFRRITQVCWDPMLRLEDLERQGVDLQVISATPVLFSYNRPVEQALEVARIFNDAALEMCHRANGRLRALCQVPLQDIDASCAEVSRCMKAGHVGVQIGNHVGSKNLDDPGIETFVHHCANVGAPVLVHPWDMMAQDRMPKYMMPWTVAMPAETQLAISALVLSGAFDRLPKTLRICFAHGGGSFGYLLGRMQNAWEHQPLARGGAQLSPVRYLDRFHVDSAIFDQRSLKLLVDVMGEDHVLLGSDYPYPLGEKHVGELIRRSQFSPNAKQKMLGDNAAEFFGLSPKAQKKRAPAQEGAVITAGCGGAALQNDGMIVVVGGVPSSSGFTVPAVLRFLSSGGLDKSFAVNGIFVLPNSFGSYAAVAIQSDGKILIGTSAGGPNAEVDRLTTTGHLDSSFGSGGRQTFHLSALLGMALQPDGRILAALQSIVGGNPKVARLLANGSTDTSFGTNGFAFTPGAGGPLEVLANGEILVFGGLISRLTSSGALDTTFGVNGQLLAPTAGHTSAADGDILVAGTLIGNPGVPTTGLGAFSYLSIGIGDPAFGKNGGVLTTFQGFPAVTASGMGLESTGDIVELGTVSTSTTAAFGLVRYTALGQLDTSFGTGGIVTTSFGSNATTNASAIAIQSDDKIVVAGTVSTALLHGQFSTSLVVVRYLGH